MEGDPAFDWTAVRDATLHAFPFLIDLYPATSINQLISLHPNGTRVVGVLVSSDHYQRFAEIEALIHTFTSLPVCWSDPDFNPLSDDTDEEESTVPHETIETLWKSPDIWAFRHQSLSIPDVNAVSLQVIGSQPTLVVFLHSIAFRPEGANPINSPRADVPLRFDVGSFKPRCLYNRVHSFQRLLCQDTARKFSLGGLISHNDSVYAISCAHSLAADRIKQLSRALASDEKGPDVPIYKTEQTEEAGRTAEETEFDDNTMVMQSNEAFKSSVFSFGKKEKYYYTQEPFGTVKWAAITNFATETHEEVIFDSHKPTPDKYYVDMIPSPVPCYGLDASLIQIHRQKQDLQFHSHPIHRPSPTGAGLLYSGQFAAPNFGPDRMHFMVGATQLYMEGKAYPIDVRPERIFDEENTRRVSRRIPGLENKPIQVVTKDIPVILFDQFAIEIDATKMERSYLDRSDDGNSGGWVFDATTGDAVGIYTASTHKPEKQRFIGVASRLQNFVDYLHSAPGWETWEPRYLIPSGVREAAPSPPSTPSPSPPLSDVSAMSTNPAPMLVDPAHTPPPNQRS